MFDRKERCTLSTTGSDILITPTVKKYFFIFYIKQVFRKELSLSLKKVELHQLHLLMSLLIKEVESVICLYCVQFHQSLSSFLLKQNEISLNYYDVDAYIRLT